MMSSKGESISEGALPEVMRVFKFLGSQVGLLKTRMDYPKPERT